MSYWNNFGLEIIREIYIGHVILHVMLIPNYAINKKEILMQPVSTFLSIRPIITNNLKVDMKTNYKKTY